MGLTGGSTGAGVLTYGGLTFEKKTPHDKLIALAGNPNVGKSTVFNALTGLKQHTGNWPGKTVSNAFGVHSRGGKDYIIADMPGTYSLMANSAEEEIARDFICFGGPDAAVVVADATCLERNLNLVLQILEITDRAVLCVNLLDEAEKKGIDIDLKLLQSELGVPVVGTSARSRKGLGCLVEKIEAVATGAYEAAPLRVVYGEAEERALALVAPEAARASGGRLDGRWAALKLLEADESLLRSFKTNLGYDLMEDEALRQKLDEAAAGLAEAGIGPEQLRDRVVRQLIITCEGLAARAVTFKRAEYAERDRKIDRLLTSRLTGYPIMIALLAGIFWITITGANYPSALLAGWLFGLGDRLHILFSALAAPEWLRGLLLDGVYRTLAWVISVMLPPMAIFFPLFTLLEDLGYLPRVAFNMDNIFRKAHAHGKQVLTMCMGFGCNAAGVIGCRIIDSPRERLIAMLTNNFVPCNGRFPTLIALIAMFFATAYGGAAGSVLATLMLTGVIVLGVGVTLLVSRALSATVLKGMPSSFHLELPPYRRPQLGQVIVRSVLDRTLFVLGRAVIVAAPMGLVIWLLANIHAGGVSLLAHCAGFLDPLGRLLGMDGFILLAFILGFPANEIVLPVLIMSYLSAGSLVDFESLTGLRLLLVENGWTAVTAMCTILFSLLHWPCGTTCLTIRKETGSLKWTVISIALPTLTGMIACFFVASAARLVGAG